MHTLIGRMSRKMDFSELYPNSYIRFNNGFMKGTLSKEEYLHRINNSAVSWCTAGFMTNETSRLIESARAGAVVLCGTLPDNELYRGNPFVLVKD